MVQVKVSLDPGIFSKNLQNSLFDFDSIRRSEASSRLEFFSGPRFAGPVFG
jgi:hypothetical protein